jgi:hypothetical protein
MEIDFDYLTEIGPKIPLSGCRWGCSFDGQRIGLIGYSIANSGRVNSDVHSRDYLKPELSPIIFYAASLTGMSISRSIRAFDQIAQATGQMGLSLVFRGELGRNEIFIRHIRTINSWHSVRLFSEGSGRWYEAGEVLAAVVDDRDERVISLAPEFETRHASAGGEPLRARPLEL